MEEFHEFPKSLPKIVCDGGIRGYSDIIVALALGADYVMIGSLFAAMDESCAEWETNPLTQERTRLYYGMSTKKVQKLMNEASENPTKNFEPKTSSSDCAINLPATINTIPSPINKIVLRGVTIPKNVSTAPTK